MYNKVKRVDTLNNIVIEEIKLNPNETPVIINDMLYIMNEIEYDKYQKGILETFFDSEDDYIIENAPYHLDDNFEKFIIE